MLHRPAQSETILRFELRRKAKLWRQESLAFAEVPISDLLLDRQQSEGMGATMGMVTWTSH